MEGMFDYDFDLGENYTDVPLTWPTASNITEEEAGTTCEEVLAESLALEECSQLVNTTELVESCKTDIQVSLICS